MDPVSALADSAVKDSEEMSQSTESIAIAARSSASKSVSSCDDSAKTDDKEEKMEECCICVEPALHAVKLPCSHVFCFLCIKGVYLIDPKCPLCRTTIPKNAIEKPKLVEKDLKVKGKKRASEDSGKGKRKKRRNSTDSPSAPDRSDSATGSSSGSDALVWFYEGKKGGWWRYDERTEQLIEKAVADGTSSIEALIAGNIYVLDFAGKVQMLKSNPNTKRNMKQDRIDASCKGIAGLLIK